MTMSLTRDQFLRNLGESGLFTPEELGETVNAMIQAQHADGQAVAQSMIAAGKLTPFQAEAVAEGRFEGLVIGNYQVLDRLGAGGMGTVYKARHRRMKRIVAIKVLTRSVGQSGKFLERFQREVEAVARLNHSNIVMAYDADEAEVGHFLAMEFVNGRDLATEVQQRGPLPVAEAADATLQAARALEYAHGQGIIHRDIKPANLLRDQAGVVKVADLGLARFNDAFGRARENETALTQAGTIMGTVDFMSPEQAMGLTDTIDHRTDIYSLGCTLYFLLLGRPPYEGPSVMAILWKHREGPIPSLRAVRAEVPAALDQVFQKMVAKKPEERFASMGEVVRALEGLALGPARTATTPPSEVASSSRAQAEPAGHTVALPPGELGPTNQTIDLQRPPATVVGGATVLLAEPSRAQAAIIRKYLGEIGFQEVSTAPSGQKALEILRGARPQVLLSAMHLPDMTGIQLARKIQADWPESRPGFVLITSQTDSAEPELQKADIPAVRLSKPFTVEQLAEALQAALDQASQRSPARTRGDLRALLVDDSAAARAHSRRVLEGLGVTQFVEAADGARAVAALAGQTFDLIVTDYNMPYMDGAGLVGFLKQNPATAAVPIIMVTTEQDPARLEAVRQLGVTVCDKSFPAEVVRKVLDPLVRAP
jgi:serine/threonine protein kinase/DNA-binding response OmpR family regulator